MAGGSEGEGEIENVEGKNDWKRDIQWESEAKEVQRQKRAIFRKAPETCTQEIMRKNLMDIKKCGISADSFFPPDCNLIPYKLSMRIPNVRKAARFHNSPVSGNFPTLCMFCSCVF